MFICTGRMTRNNRNENSIVRIHSDGMHRATHLKMNRPEPSSSEDNYARSFCLSFFSARWIFMLQIGVIFLRRRPTRGSTNNAASWPLRIQWFFPTKNYRKKQNAQSTRVKRSSIILLLFIFSPNERWLRSDGRHLGCQGSIMLFNYTL